MEQLDPINVAVGERLRQARRQRSWSLLDVEHASASEFKASVLGAYERGERALSVARLVRLAEILEVTPASLLPGSTGDGETVIDLTLDRDLEIGGSAIDEFLNAIRSMRRGGDGPVLTIRQSDIKVLSALIEAHTGLGVQQANVEDA